MVAVVIHDKNDALKKEGSGQEYSSCGQHRRLTVVFISLLYFLHAV